MAARGRKPKPTALKVLEGNPGKRPLNGHEPIPLLAYPIKNSSAPNGVVMDLFGGSGSTLIACEQTDRICRTMELDPKYASVIVQRFKEGYPESDIHAVRNGQPLSLGGAMEGIKKAPRSLDAL